MNKVNNIYIEPDDWPYQICIDCAMEFLRAHWKFQPIIIGEISNNDPQNLKHMIQISMKFNPDKPMDVTTMTIPGMGCSLECWMQIWGELAAELGSIWMDVEIALIEERKKMALKHVEIMKAAIINKENE